MHSIKVEQNIQNCFKSQLAQFFLELKQQPFLENFACLIQSFKTIQGHVKTDNNRSHNVPRQDEAGRLSGLSAYFLPHTAHIFESLDEEEEWQ